MPPSNNNPPIAGLLCVDKTAGRSSRDVVNLVQRQVKPAKVGHAGTLDPIATGVLVVAVGWATRLIEYVQAQPKTYIGTFRLGETSPTEDIEGEVQPLDNPPLVTEDQIRNVLPQFTGRIQQLPPAYSALKVDGKRAYKLARQGKEVTLQPREIQIHELTIVSLQDSTLKLKIRCGSGTYVRSLGRDIARAVGSDAVMSALVRTAIGPFTLDSAVDCDTLVAGDFADRLQPPQAGLSQLRTHRLTATETIDLQRGRPIHPSELPLPATPNHTEQLDNHITALDPHGRLFAVLKPDPRGWRAAKAFWDFLPDLPSPGNSPPSD